MSKHFIRLSVILGMILGLFFTAEALKEKPPGPTPDIRILLSLDKAPTEPYHPKEPIEVTLSLTNAGSEEVMREGWTAMEFWLLLQFYDENGKLISESTDKGD